MTPVEFHGNMAHPSSGGEDVPSPRRPAATHENSMNPVHLFIYGTTLVITALALAAAWIPLPWCATALVLIEGIFFLSAAPGYFQAEVREETAESLAQFGVGRAHLLADAALNAAVIVLFFKVGYAVHAWILTGIFLVSQFFAMKRLFHRGP